MDLACKSGVGVQQNKPITQQTKEAIADGASSLSRQAGVIGAAATSATAAAPLQVKPITGTVAVGATAIGMAAGTVEQLARPNTGQTVVDMGGLIIQTATERLPYGQITAPATNELLEMWRASGTLQSAEDWINERLGQKP